jgi:hypothetical protein
MIFQCVHFVFHRIHLFLEYFAHIVEPIYAIADLLLLPMQFERRELAIIDLPLLVFDSPQLMNAHEQIALALDKLLVEVIATLILPPSHLVQQPRLLYYVRSRVVQNFLELNLAHELVNVLLRSAELELS